MFQRIVAFFRGEEAKLEAEIKHAELLAEAIGNRVAADVTAAIKRDLAKIKAAIPKPKK